MEPNSAPTKANYISQERKFPVVFNSSGAFIMKACTDEILL